MDQQTSIRIIDALGGTVAVAAMCKVTKGAVSQWRINGIPAARELYFRAVRPDLFEAFPVSAAADHSCHCDQKEAA